MAEIVTHRRKVAVYLSLRDGWRLDLARALTETSATQFVRGALESYLLGAEKLMEKQVGHEALEELWRAWLKRHG